MNTTLTINDYNTGEELHNFTLSFCPNLKVGEELTLDINVEDQQTWDIEEETVTYTIQEIEHEIRLDHAKHKIYETYFLTIKVTI